MNASLLLQEAMPRQRINVALTRQVARCLSDTVSIVFARPHCSAVLPAGRFADKPVRRQLVH